MKTKESLLELVAAGAHLDLSDSGLTSESLAEIAGACRRAGTTLIVGDKPTKESLLKIVAAGGGNVTVKVTP